MADTKSPNRIGPLPGTKDYEVEQEGHRRGKRLFFTSLLKPFVAAVKGYELPDDAASAQPPVRRRVIRRGSDARVLQMLGPLAKGETIASATVGSYRLWGVKIEDTRIEITFESGGRKVRLLLAGLETISAPVPVGGVPPRLKTLSFAIAVDGDAPEADRITVSDRVGRELAARDKGDLWVDASTAPMKSPTKPPASGGPGSVGS